MNLTIEPTDRQHAPAIQRLATHPDIAATTLMPHPYPDDGAIRFIEDRVLPGRETGTHYAFVMKNGDEVVGHISLKDVNRAQAKAEVGYWVGRPFWGHGYGTAALRLVLAFAFETLGLDYVYAHVLAYNPGSGRVLEKNGFARVDLPPDEMPDACTAKGETWGYALTKDAWKVAG